MTTVPISIVDDFLDNPDDIRKWALSLPYSRGDKYPGQRTDHLANVHLPFYNFINDKVNNLFYSSNFFGRDVKVNSNLYFQRIDNFEGDGWVHQDWGVYTYIIYLTPDTDINCGTSFYKLKSPNFYSYLDSNDYKVDNLRNEHHATGKISDHNKKLKKEFRDSRFEKTLDVNDRYNRLVVFPCVSFVFGLFLLL